MLFRSLYQDLIVLQPVRSGCDIVDALARPDKMELREIVKDALSASGTQGSVSERQHAHRGRERHRTRGVSHGAIVEVKLRDLKHGHEGFPRVHAWPPIWMPGGRVSKGGFGAEGVLVSVKRLEDHLALRMRYEGRDHTGRLQWDPPPVLTALEQILRANLGKAIQDLGELGV